MTCRACGYIMTAFDADCPRCRNFRSLDLTLPLVTGKPPEPASLDIAASLSYAAPPPAADLRCPACGDSFSRVSSRR